jgi:hypothetical protein
VFLRFGQFDVIDNRINTQAVDALFLFPVGTPQRDKTVQHFLVYLMSRA